MGIHVNIYNYVYYKISQLTLRFEQSTIIILYKRNSDALKANYLNKYVFITFGLIITHKFIKININNPNYICYKFFPLKL